VILLEYTVYFMYIVATFSFCCSVQ